MNATWRILTGDVRESLAALPDGSVQCCVTSPPYWGLRDYGHAGQIGLEDSPEAYVAELVAVFAGVWRVLALDGVLWLNLGDSYAGSGKGGNPEAGKQATNKGSQTIGVLYGTGRTAREAAVTNVSRRFTAEHDEIKCKDLVGIPWMVAFALRADGWYLRSDIVWSKPNPMPESVTDRPTKSHEYIFLLTKSARYQYDANAIAEPVSESMLAQIAQGYKGAATKNYDAAGAQDPSATKYRILSNARAKQRVKATGGAISGGVDNSTLEFPRETRNSRSVWVIPTSPYPDAHFATFPEAIPERCIKAGSKEGDTILDPFCGSGTSGAVAVRHGRHFVGCELNPAYVELARTRIGAEVPMFSQEVAADHPWAPPASKVSA